MVEGFTLIHPIQLSPMWFLLIITLIQQAAPFQCTVIPIQGFITQ